MAEKAYSIRVVACGCGRIAIALLDKEDRMFASAELDPKQWLLIARDLENRNQELLDKGMVFHDHKHGAH